MSNPIDLINQSLSDLQSREKFCAAFKSACQELGMTNREIAKTFQIQVDTVERWMTSVTCVHHVGREPILKYLRHSLRSVGLREIVMEAKSL